MEEEIDLREYVKVLLRWRWWIAGLALVAAVVALGVSLLLPRQYEAIALIAVTEPRYVMRFDPRFETTNNIQPLYKAYPELAASDELLQDVLARLDPPPKEIETLDNLRGIVEAESGADPSMTRLKVRAPDPVEAARIANAWAEQFVVRANEIYGAQSDEQVQFFEDQLEQAGLELETAEQALIAFQARNEQAILETKLDSARQDQADYLAELRELERLLRNVEGLRAQFATRSEGVEVTRGDELAVLQLRTQALTSAGTSEQIAADSGAAGSVQLHLLTNPAAAGVQLLIGEGEPLAGRTVTELIALLDALQRQLEHDEQESEARLTELEPQILALQHKVQEMDSRANRLIQDRDVARGTHLTLARKVAEARIAVQDASGEVQLASRAAVPHTPIGPRKLLNTAVGGALGLMVGVFGAFAMEWWQGGMTSASTR